MLIISRKINERVMIGDNIIITICDVDRGKTRIGIEAPKDIPVHRSELLDVQPCDQKPNS